MIHGGVDCGTGSLKGVMIATRQKDFYFLVNKIIISITHNTVYSPNQTSAVLDVPKAISLFYRPQS